MGKLGKNLKNYLQFLYRFHVNQWNAYQYIVRHSRRRTLNLCLILGVIFFSVNNGSAQVLTVGSIGVDQSNCTNGSFDPAILLSITSATGTSLSYQWASSTFTNVYNATTASRWTNISGQTGLNYDPPAVSQTTYFVRLVRSGAGAWTPSNVVTITLNVPSFNITASSNSPSCNGGPINLSATANSYGSNLVTNGDFTAGNTSFTSDFKNIIGGDTTNAVSSCNKYRIATLPVTNWSSCPDLGHGNVLLANNNGNPNSRAWIEAGVNVTSGTTYTFQVDASSISWQNFAQLYLTVNGVTVSPIVPLQSPCGWTTITGTYTATSTGTVTLAVANQIGVCTGDDYMLDNIKFRANTSAPSGSWSWTGPNSFASPSQNPSISSASPSNAGTYTVSFSAFGCTAVSTTTTSLKLNPTVAATNGGSYCTGNTIALTANTVDPNSTTGSWSWTGPNSFTSSTRNPTILNATMAMAGTYSVIYVSDSCGYTASSSTAVIVNSAIAVAGPNQSLCAGSFTMAANVPAPGSGVWSLVSGTATITTTNSATSTITGVPVGSSATLRWTVTNGICTSSDNVILTNAMTTANAGSDIIQCGTGTFTMAANNPSVGTGVWTVVSGTASILSTSYNTTITGVPSGTNATLRWTVTNGSCSSSDDIILTHNAITIANAGVDKNQCANGNFTMTANSPTAGTGAWSFLGLNNGATITSSTVSTTTVNSLNANKSATLVWTITNGICISKDTVILNNYPLNSPGCNCDNIYSISGPDSLYTGENQIRIMNMTNGTYTAQFGVNLTVPTYGMGLDTTYKRFYYTSNNPGSDLSIYYLDAYGANANTGVGLPATSETYNRGGFNPVDKKMYFISSGGAVWASYTPTANGAGGTVAALSPVTYYPASAPAINATNGGGDIVFDFDGNGYILTNSGQFYKAIFNSNGSVDVTYLGKINLPINQLASLAFGVDGKLYLSGRGALNGSHYMGVDVYYIDLQTLLTTKITTASQVPSSTDYSSCSFPIYRSTINPTKAYAKISGSAGATIAEGDIVEYTIVIKHTGNISIGNVKLSDAIPAGTSYVAGSALLNGVTATDTLGGFRFAMVGGFLVNSTTEGTYSGVIVPNDSAIIKFRVRINVSCGNVFNTAQVTSGVLNFSQSTNTVDIFSNTPSTSDAGLSQIRQCNNSNFTMTANVPPSSGSGLWTLVSGTATITTPTAYNTTVTGVLAGQSALLRWTVNNGACSTPASDTVRLYNDSPVTATAGVDQSLCNNSTFTMAANTPSVGTGVWTVVSGSGTITSSNSPTTTITGVTLGTSTTLRWTVTNNSCVATDDIIVTNVSNGLTSNAGVDQSQCNNGSFTMAANNPASTTKTWSLISGTATITSTSTYNTTISGVPVGTSATLRWTVSNGICSVSDDVILNNYQTTTANAGADQSLCRIGNFTLAANSPSVGTGAWTVIGAANGSVITAPSSATSTVTGLNLGTSVILRWTVTNGSCSSTDDVILTNVQNPLANAGLDQDQCNNSAFTVTGSDPAPTSGLWTLVSGTATISTPSGRSTAVNVPVGTTSTLRWTITYNGCTTTDDVVLTNNADPSVNSVSNQTVCNNASTTAISFSGTGTTYNWTNTTPSIGLVASGTGNIAAFTAINAGVSAVTATITVTPIANGCPGTPTTFTITVNPTPTVNSVSNQTVCVGANTVVNFTGTISGTTYNWANNNTNVGLAAIGSGNISFVATNAGASPITATITVTPVVNGCTGASTNFTITVFPDPSVSVSASNATICTGGSSTLTATVSNGTGTTSYQWQSSTDNISFSNIGSATGSIYTATNLTTTTYFRVNITQTGSGCNNVTSSTIKTTVVTDPIVTASVPESTICVGGGVVLTASYTGGTGTCTIQWQTRPDAVSTWTDIPSGTGNTYITPALNTSSRYRALVSCSGNGCCN